jgi:MFS transporter, DHA2 family, methylenomycin A resistance protein
VTTPQHDTNDTGNTRARSGTLIATSLGFAVIQLDVTVVNVAVKQIGVAFGGGVSELQWVISAYTLMFAALILTGGALGDRFGARRVFATGFGLFVVASMACGLAPSIGVLIGARAVQGAGAAILGSSSLALLSHTFQDERESGRALGLLAAGASVALSGGPVIGGVLIATLGWRSIFFINLPLGLIGLWLTRRYAEETPRAENNGLDLAGQVTGVVALAAFAAATIVAGPNGLTNHLVLAGYAISLLAAIAFITLEARTPRPMLPLSLFKRPAFASPALIGLLVNICFYGLIFVFSLLFQVQDHDSALKAGLRRRFCWCPPQQVLLGGGLGLLVPPMTGSLLRSVERSRSGVASGTLNAMRQTGSLLGIALFGSLTVGRGHFFAGLHAALLISIGVLIAGGVLARRLAAAQRP